jgi:hypothetical protein
MCQKGAKMRKFEDALRSVQNDTVLDFYKFLEEKWNDTDDNDLIERFKNMRTVAEVGLAIVAYAQSKE